MQEGAAARLIKARILPEDRGKDRTGHEILDGAVGEISGVALAVAFHALAVCRFAVIQLAKAGNPGNPYELPPVERASGDRFELLAGGEGRDLAGILQCQEIRNQVEHVVVRGPGLGRRRSHVRRHLRRRSDRGTVGPCWLLCRRLR